MCRDEIWSFWRRMQAQAQVRRLIHCFLVAMCPRISSEHLTKGVFCPIHQIPKLVYMEVEV